MNFQSYDTSNIGFVVVDFRYHPNSNGVFSIVNAGNIYVPTDLDSTQCAIAALVVSGTTYNSDGRTGNLSVTVTGGKLHLIFNGVSMKNVLNSSDSTLLSGSLYEK